MPIYEYYCPDNHTIYQFYAKTLAQGRTVPPCPADPAFRMQKVISRFAFNTGVAEPVASPSGTASAEGPDGDDPRMAAAMAAMESEFAGVDENDPRAMGRMMRRMAEITGEPIRGEMEEVVRKLEEGADPESLEAQMGTGEDEEGGGDSPYGDLGGGGPAESVEGGDAGGSSAAGAASGGLGSVANLAAKLARSRAQARRAEPVRDPLLHDYPAT